MTGFNMRSLGVLSGVLLAASLAACQRQLSESEYLARAQASFASNDLKAAVLDLKSAIQQHPDSKEARVLLGQIYTRVGDGASAVKELQAAQRLGVSQSDVIVPLARAYLLKKDYKSVTELQLLGADSKPREDFRTLSPRDVATVLAVMGDAHFATEDYDAAEAKYRLSLDTSPGNADATVGMAKLDLLKGDVKAASEALKKLVEVEPTASAWGLLGDLAVYNGRFDEAVKYFDSSLKQAPNNIDNRVSKAVSLVLLNRFEEAKNELDVLKRLFGKSPFVNYVAGVIAERDGRLNDAKTALLLATNAMPKFVPATYSLGLVHFKLKEYEQADTAFSRVVEARPEFTDGSIAIALTKLASLDYEGATKVLRGVLQRDPQNDVALKLLSEVAMKRGDSEEGLQYLQELIDREKGSPQAYRSLGNGLTLAGRYDEAREAYLRAVDAGGELSEIGYDVIYSALLHGDSKEALRQARDMVTRNPGDTRALVTLAYIHLTDKDFTQADSALNQVLEKDPKHAAALYFLGKSLLAQGKTEDAHRHFLQANEAVPRISWLLSGLGLTELKLNKYEDAGKHFAEALSLEPRLKEPRLGLISMAGRQKDFAEAFRLAKEGLKHRPHDVQLLRAYAAAASRLNEDEKAASALEDVASLMPDDPTAHYDLAQIYLKQGDVPAMAKHLDRVEALDPKHLGVGILRARHLITGGQVEDAERKIEQLKKDHGELPAIRKQEALLKIRKNDYPAAMAIYESLLQTRPNDRDAMMHLAQVYTVTNQQEKAQARLEEWVRAHPADYLLHEQLASVYLRQKQNGKAVALYKQILERQPKNLRAMNNLALLLMESEPERAVALIESALKADPDNVEIMDSAAQVFAAAGRLDESIDLGRKALKAHDNPRFKIALARLLDAKGGHADEVQQLLASVNPSDLVKPEDREWLKQARK